MLPPPTVRSAIDIRHSSMIWSIDISIRGGRIVVTIDTVQVSEKSAKRYVRGEMGGVTQSFVMGCQLECVDAVEADDVVLRTRISPCLGTN